MYVQACECNAATQSMCECMHVTVHDGIAFSKQHLPHRRPSMKNTWTSRMIACSCQPYPPACSMSQVCSCGMSCSIDSGGDDTTGCGPASWPPTSSMPLLWLLLECACWFDGLLLFRGPPSGSYACSGCKLLGVPAFLLPLHLSPMC